MLFVDDPAVSLARKSISISFDRIQPFSRSIESKFSFQININVFSNEVSKERSMNKKQRISRARSYSLKVTPLFFERVHPSDRRKDRMSIFFSREIFRSSSRLLDRFERGWKFDRACLSTYEREICSKFAPDSKSAHLPRTKRRFHTRFFPPLVAFVLIAFVSYREE